jgi:NAD(P)H-flavin reductase
MEAVKHIPQVSAQAVAVKATVSAKVLLAKKMYEVVVQPSSGEKFVDFTPGQFAMVEVAPNIKRAYSIASLPEDSGSLTFCVGTAPGGVGSKFFESLEIGDTLNLELPYGVFTVKSAEKPLLFVATGSGIAPFKAMVPDLLANRFDRPVDLLFGVRSEADLFYAEFFANLAAQYSNFRFLATLSQPTDAWTGSAGRVTAILEECGGDYINSQVYICGSKEMIMDVRKVLMAKGLPALSMKFEIFN